MSQDEATLISEEIKPVAIDIIEVGCPKSVNQSRNFVSLR